MATRRPTTRTRNAMPPPTTTNRPRSALAKSGSSQRSNLTTPVDELERSTPAPPSHPPSPRRKPTKPTQALPPSQHGQDESESHIQVVIRCRRRSEREIQDNSPIIASCNGPRSTEVTIETAAPVSSLGLVTLPPTRTYPFDLVFGPEADQAMIYNDVVHPLLDEVLQGYNCTLFAYGQTGTGKTYTMQGDLNPTPMGNPSANAGMIPRVLFRLFHQLESSVADYSVKISYVELYNEELRDLLAPELAAPSGTVQPMGLGGPKDNNQAGLKIFEESNKKGVFIQGLEEPSVKDAADALSLLAKGSHRRQVAATKFNDHSSRSHSVFSITIHTKETSSMGDDLLKVGKLNLVDLAGSENIGRSGAENKRAREAGMINQSLLTLGRVINALVDKSSHIPYRESKLTRLLQDSLGGRTKTCIIATISPARSNMEETLSTLDYAMRAKSIRNRPEVNQRMTRNSLLKEYVAEIERLKSDLLAAREKNGIFFSEETWNQMTAENELRQTEIEEAKKQVEIVEGQMKAVREEFEQSIALLMRKEGELKETREKLRGTEEELQTTTGQLRAAKGALEEEVVVRQAYQSSEAALDEVARGLKGVASDSIKDLGRLFEKLERKSEVLGSNSQAVQTHTKAISGDLQGLESSLADLLKTSGERTSRLKTLIDQYRSKELQSLSSQSKAIEEQVKRFQSSVQILEAKEEVSSEAVKALEAGIASLLGNLKTSWQTWTQEVHSSHEELSKGLSASTLHTTKSVENVMLSLHTLLERTISEAHAFIESERTTLTEVKTMTDATSTREIARLREQNKLFAKLLESEKAKSQRAQDELLERVSGLITSFAAERDRSLRASFSQLQTENAAAEAGVTQFNDEVGRKAEERVIAGKEWRVGLERRESEGKRARDGTLKTLSSVNASITNGLSEMQSSMSTSFASYSSNLQRETQSVQASSNTALDRIHRAKRARLETTNSMGTDFQSSFRSLQRGVAGTSRNIETMSDQVSSETTSIRDTTAAYHAAATERLASARQSASVLLDKGTRRDTPTGTTPRKRSWSYKDQWETTKDREAVLKSWRQRNISEAGNETFLAEHLPLPSESGESDGAVSENDCDTQAEDQTTIKLPDVHSMSTSSTSSASTSSPPPDLPPPPALKTRAAPDIKLAPSVALTERPSNLPTGRRIGRRRIP